MLQALDKLGHCEYEYLRLYLLKLIHQITLESGSDLTSNSRSTSITGSTKSSSIDSVSEENISTSPISRSRSSTPESESNAGYSSTPPHTETPILEVVSNKSPYFTNPPPYKEQKLVAEMRTRSQTQSIKQPTIEDEVRKNLTLNTPPTTPLGSKSKLNNRRSAEDDEGERPPTPESLPNKKRRQGRTSRKEVEVVIPSRVEVLIGRDEIGREENIHDPSVINLDRKSNTKQKKGTKTKLKEVNDGKITVDIVGQKEGKKNGKATGKWKQKRNGEEEDQEIITRSEKGIVEQIDKIHLIQEKLRFNPWKMLIATSLLNKTAGRAARPILEILLGRYPTPQSLSEASITDLSELLYPLGLYNQRASSLIRFSRQYLDLNWPLFEKTKEPLHTEDLPPLPIPQPHLGITTIVDLDPSTKVDLDPSPLNPIKERARKSTKKPNPLGDRDVKVFHGSGLYASDSFRIFSNLLPGRGAPQNESNWLAKCEEAKVNMKENGVEWDGSIGQLAEYMSDQEQEEQEGGGQGEEEWRKVIPLDKELRRYLIWRWGIEGITYDIHTGPIIVKERDKKRLSYLLDQD